MIVIQCITHAQVQTPQTVNTNCWHFFTKMLRRSEIPRRRPCDAGFPPLPFSFLIIHPGNSSQVFGWIATAVSPVALGGLTPANTIPCVRSSSFPMAHTSKHTNTSPGCHSAGISSTQTDKQAKDTRKDMCINMPTHTDTHSHSLVLRNVSDSWGLTPQAYFSLQFLPVHLVGSDSLSSSTHIWYIVPVHIQITAICTKLSFPNAASC